MAATVQIAAAVVSPTICSPRIMVPAPKKPMPITMPAATLDGSLSGPKPYPEAIVNRVAPRQNQQKRAETRWFFGTFPLVSYQGAYAAGHDKSEHQV